MDDDRTAAAPTRRSLLVLAGWYAVPLAPLTMVVCLAGTIVEDERPVRTCTSGTMDCWHMSGADVVRLAIEVTTPVILVSLVFSLLTMAVVRRFSGWSALAIGTVSALVGWLGVAVVCYTLIALLL